MIDKLLQEFAEENFGDLEGNFFPVVYGRIQEIKLFALLVKKEPFMNVRLKDISSQHLQD